MIDSDGQILDGDDLLYILAFSNPNRLGVWSGVVGTKMSNFGLEDGHPLIQNLTSWFQQHQTKLQVDLGLRKQEYIVNHPHPRFDHLNQSSQLYHRHHQVQYHNLLYFLIQLY